MSSLQIAFDASGAAEAGSRGRVVAIVDVIDAATSAEVALAAGAIAVLGAAPSGVTPPVGVDPRDVGMRAGSIARDRGTDVVVVAEPRVAAGEDRGERIASVARGIEESGVSYEVVANQGAELGSLAKLEGRVVVVVSSAGGAAFDSALQAGAPAVTFATTARIPGLTGWEVARRGVTRAVELATRHDTGLSVVASSANSTDDCLAAFEVARAVIDRGFLRPG